MLATHEQKGASESGQSLRCVTGLRLLLSISSIIWTWVLCWWLPFWFVIFYVTPFLLVLSWLITWTVERRVPKWEYRWSERGYRLYWAAILVLITAAPVSSYLYGRWLAREFIEELGVEVRLVEEKVSVLEQFGFGERRGVLSVYEFLEPREIAEEKIRQRILAQGKPVGIEDRFAALGWQLGNDGLNAGCESGNGTYTDIWINKHGQLIVNILFYTSPYCRLK